MSTGAAPIQVTCPQCAKQLAVPAQHAGKQGRCPACKSVFSIPSAPAAPAQPAYQASAPAQPAYQPAPQSYPAAPQMPAYPQQAAWQQPQANAWPQQQPAAQPQWPAPAQPNWNASQAAAPSAPAIPNPFGQGAPAAPGYASPFGNGQAQGGYGQQPSPFGAAAQPAPMQNFQPLYPAQQGLGAAPLQSTNPFADQDGGELRLAPAEPTAMGHSLAPAYNAYSAPLAPNKPDAYSGAFGSEKRGMDAGVWGGLGLMLLAVVWFVGGLAFNVFFCYPPVLFIIGIVAVVRGLFNR